MWLAAHPLCAECKREGRIRAGEVVDHIEPHRGDWSKFWDSNNWQSLCDPCHRRKTADETFRAGKDAA
jgi:5-methylcytosine-specific restriction protein A